MASTTANAHKRPKVFVPASEEEFRRLGADIMNRDPEGRSPVVFLRRWVSFFGVEPVVCAITWDKLQVSVNDGTEMDYAKPEHLLWALLLLKKYSGEEDLATLAGGKGPSAVDEKTFRKWSHIFVRRIAFLVFDVVRDCFSPVS